MGRWGNRFSRDKERGDRGMINLVTQLALLISKLICFILFILALPFVCIAGAVSGFAKGVKRAFSKPKVTEVVWEPFVGYRKKGE